MWICESESLIRDTLFISTRYSSTPDCLRRERPVPGLARCIEARRASELSRIRKEQFKDTVDSPNTVHAAETIIQQKRKGKGNSGSSNGIVTSLEKKNHPVYERFVSPIIRMIEPNVLRLVSWKEAVPK